MGIEIAQLVGAALTGAGSVWGVLKFQGRRNGHGNGTNVLESRLKQVETRLIPLEGLAASLPVEIRYLTKSVDSLNDKVDDLMKRS